MLFQLYAIKDRSVEAFQPMSCCRAEGEALRAFHDALSNPQNGVIHKHPDDFDLWYLGTYDDQTGHISAEQPRKVADGKTFSQLGE